MTDRGLSSRQVALLVAFAMVGIALRFVDIDRSYWFDELATLNTIDQSNWLTVLQITAKDNQPPLYNSAAFVWMNLFGLSEIALRSLSIVLGLLAVCTPWLARTSLSRNEKLLCFTILCLMPLPIRHAQEARNYSLLFLMSATCLFLYFETLKRNSRALQILFHASLILLAFSHLFGLLLAVCFLAVLFFWRQRSIAARLGLILYGIVLSVLIMVPLLRGGSGQHVAGNFWITFSAATLSKQLLMVFTPVGIALGIYALLRWRRDPARARMDPDLLAALMPFILMLAGSIAVSFNTPILTDRNLIGLTAAYALLVAWLLQRISAPNSASLSVLLLGLFMLQTVALTFSPILFIQQDFRSIAKYSIATHSRVCYVLPGTMKTPPPHIFAFYVSRLYGHPELSPEQKSLAAVPQDPAGADCPLWAEATLEKRGSTVLGNLPQFSHCISVPLIPARPHAASELWDCRQPAITPP